MKSDKKSPGISDGRKGKVPDPIRPWFEASEDLGNHIGIRFGRIAPGSSDPDWVYRSHADFDGIGGFADILMKRGVDVGPLKTIPHKREPSWGPFFKSLPLYLQKRQKVIWNRPLESCPSRSDMVPPAVAWHVFDEEMTERIRTESRKGGYTVNSFLLKHLSDAIFPDISEKTPFIPWMVPVNLRGKASRESELENHSSYVRVLVNKNDSSAQVHHKIYDELDKGGHWASWRSYEGMQFLPRAVKRHLIKIDLVTAQWMIGAFSNIGVWDNEKSFTGENIDGDWLFCPPAISFFKLSSGCVTYRGRLSLCMQTHPELSCNIEDVRQWMSNWVRFINNDILNKT